MSEPQKQFGLYKDAKGEWRWTLYAANSKKIADSAEGYNNRQDCLHGARLVASVSTGAPIYDHHGKAWVQ